jgi:hypothetical protein
LSYCKATSAESLVPGTTDYLSKKVVELLELLTTRLNLLNYKTQADVFQIPEDGIMVLQFIGTGAVITMTVNGSAGTINSGNVLVSGAHYEFAYNVLNSDRISFDVQPFRIFELLYSGG